MQTPRAEIMPPELDQQLVCDLSAIADFLDGHPPTAQRNAALAQFNQLAGSSLDIDDFQDLHEAMSADEFVRIILYQMSVQYDPHLTVDEMAWIVQRILAGDDDQDFYIELFSDNCKHPSGTGLIFWPEQVADLSSGNEPTARQIAELAMREKNIEFL